jgi:uncharacterized protein (TIRG00374 family)
VPSPICSQILNPQKVGPTEDTSSPPRKSRRAEQQPALDLGDSIRRKWVRFVVLLGVLLALTLFINPREIGKAITRVSPASLLLATAILSLDRVVMGLKWQHLIRGAGGYLRFRDAVGIYFQSKFVTLAFPASFGGEVLRGILAMRAGLPSHLVVASMVLERVIAAVSSTVLAGLGLAYLFATRDDTYHPPTLLVGIAALAAFTIATAALNRRLHAAVARPIRRHVPQRAFRFLNRLSAAASGYRSRPGVLAVNLGLNIGEHLLQMLALLVLARGLGVTLGFVQFLAATAIIMLVRRGAGLLEGWGLAESGLVMLYNLSGVPAAQSAALALTLWATSLCASLPGALLLPRLVVRNPETLKGSSLINS